MTNSNTIAYEFAGITFCEACATENTRAPMRFIPGLEAMAEAETMDSLIAAMVLYQVERNMPIDVPVLTTTPQSEYCMNEVCRVRLIGGAA